MEVVGVEFIALNDHIAVAKFLQLVDGPRLKVGWSVPAHQRLETTVNNNSYASDYKCIKYVIRCQIKQARTVREDTKNQFYRTDTFEFLWFSTGGRSTLEGRTVCAWSQMVLFSPSNSPY
jgi:hypothetical protein